MGYSHYYEIHGFDSVKWNKIWPRLVRDAKRIIEESNVELCGNLAREKSRQDNLVPPIAHRDDGIQLNGVDDLGHETFFFGHDGCWNCCKTARKPYDLVVSTILLRAYMLAPKCIKVSSDDDWDQQGWEGARELYEELWPGEQLVCPWEARRKAQG